MKRRARLGLWVSFLLVLGAAQIVRGDSGEDLREREFFRRVAEAAERADTVVVGDVTAKRNYQPADGGFGYDVSVRETLKGSAASRVSFRAGGWAYSVDLAIGTQVLVFLSETRSFGPKDPFSVALDSNGHPLVFEVRQGQLEPASSPSDPGWTGRSPDEVRVAIAKAR